MPHDLTLVIPCYRESSHIDRSARELLYVLQRSALDWELVFLDDCSPDDTLEHLQRIAALDDRIRVQHNETNLGRGATLTKGFRASQARVVGFLDIDLSTQPVYVPYLTHLILDGEVDVATALRTYKVEPAVLHRVWHRIVLSHGYRTLSRNYLNHGLFDTETGCKFFDREKLLPILDRIDNGHWFWDTEVMVYARRAGLRIREVQSIFIRRPEKPSTVRIVRDVTEYLRCIVAFKRKLDREDRG